MGALIEKGYKYSEIRDFCQTSDRMMAHMIYNYFKVEWGITCHFQNPGEMKEFILACTVK
jgi:hypothetical protein